MRKRKKRNVNSFSTLLELSKTDVTRTYRLLPFYKALSCAVTAVFVLAIIVGFVLLTVNVYGFFMLGIFLLLPICIMLELKVYKKLTAFDKIVTKIYKISMAIKVMPIVFLDDMVFNGYNLSNSVKLARNIIKAHNYTDCEFFGDLLIAKSSLHFTKKIATSYFNDRLNPDKSKALQLVLNMADTPINLRCDNCGSLFARGERFCAHCGTLRKDLRRRA